MAGMLRAPSGSSSRGGARDKTPTATTQRADGSEGPTLALYVTAPKGGTRHLLPVGVVRLGRGSNSTIVVDDHRVSRSHAALHVGSEIMLSDLGSVNGTFLGKERLRPGDVQPLLPGQTFFVGDSALVVRPTSLASPCPKRVSSLDEIREKYSGSPSGLMAVIKVRPLRPTQTSLVEAILGEVLCSADDWMLWAGADHVFLGMAAGSDTEVLTCERAVVQQLANWSALADVESSLVHKKEIEKAGEGLRGLFAADAPVPSSRRPVVIRDPVMVGLKRTIARVAAAPVPVLILGETGVGKEVVASMVHELSPRAQKPFVRVNCASLPEPLLESELFGYQRGAFTGAAASKVGLLEAADGGTVFLDELGETPLSVQAKILRAIESREVMPVGAIKPRIVDVRFVAATNRDLAAAIAAGGFRQDLYYRLNCVTLVVPPLRERPSEIEAMARLFMDSACARFGSGEMSFSPAALASLTNYPWPGNARELRNVIERAVLLTPARIIEPHHLGLASIEGRSVTTSLPAEPTTSDPPRVDIEDQRERIAQALQRFGGNQRRAAKFLGIPLRTLVRQIARLGLPRPRESGK
jgi:DNA-binding NtrC family response regulator/pSer/pThr/pTyr-binding forkhead associated (FHA) protein